MGHFDDLANGSEFHLAHLNGTSLQLQPAAHSSDARHAFDAIVEEAQHFAPLEGYQVRTYLAHPQTGFRYTGAMLWFDKR